MWLWGEALPLWLLAPQHVDAWVWPLIAAQCRLWCLAGLWPQPGHHAVVQLLLCMYDCWPALAGNPWHSFDCVL